MTSSALFDGLFLPEPIAAAVSDHAWIAAMLEFEAALAVAEARVGVIPPDAAEAIEAACEPDGFDPATLGREARASGNPAAPLVAALTEKVEGDAAGYVHWGATSQDVLDTAAMLVARRTLATIQADLHAVAQSSASLADSHRGTLMPARTLMQQALPTTFGLKAAGWLTSALHAGHRLARLRLPVQLGGAAGTLAALGDRGLAVLRELGAELGLAEPVVPWHAERSAVAELGAALAISASALDKLALDVVLMSQTEVGELSEAAGEGRGGSSTLPHKRNPVASIRVRACARGARAAAGLLIDSRAGEHERAAGAWPAEWSAVSDALRFTGGAAAAMREAVEGIEVHPERMRQNLERTGGLVMTEALTMALAERVGRGEAKQLVERAIQAGGSLREALSNLDQLEPEEVERALEPSGYLGAADALIDRALEAYRAG